MRTRARHGLDMLPLLDVFMVVLFVFATIQEDRLDSSTERAEDLRAIAETAQKEADLARAQAQRDAEAAATARRQLQAAEDAIRAQAEASGSDPVREQDVLSKLLDHFSVFEVEISGRVTADDGTIENRCCYRDDPKAGAWSSCGTVPPLSEARIEWLDGGAEGLMPALRRTKGGNAMVVVRQDDAATYRIAHHVDELLRERFADHKIYAEGGRVALAKCD